ADNDIVEQNAKSPAFSPPFDIRDFLIVAISTSQYYARRCWRVDFEVRIGGRSHLHNDGMAHHEWTISLNLYIYKFENVRRKRS
ncbi:MAG: hypothetical protein KJN99_14140, partial [Marinicaulis sp.]|nr:hypothetical protein [Marinicaulis sp.]